MSLDPFIYFNGNCREAVLFYSEAFGLDKPEFMTYGQSPGSWAEEDKGRVIYSSLSKFGSTMMFCDCTSGDDAVKGDNIALTIGVDDRDELIRLFEALSSGGKIDMELGNTFFSELYGAVTDKFGIPWQLSLNAN